MNWKTKSIVALLAAGVLAAGAWFITRKHSLPAVTVTLRIGINPEGESTFVIAQANSARFKYLMGKQAGVKPVLAQKLEAKAGPKSSQMEARLSVATVEQARRYAEVFVPTLQEQCGARARLSLVEQFVR